MKSKLETMLENLKTLEIKCDEAEAAYVADPENPDAEAAFDKAYSEEFSALNAAVAEIVIISNGDINPGIARKMILTRREELEGLVARLVD